MLTDKDKVDIIKDYILYAEIERERLDLDDSDFPNYNKAKQWLAEIEAQQDGWTDVVFPRNNNIVEVKFKDGTVSKGYYSRTRNEWFNEIGDDFDFDIVAWKPITPPKK